MSEFGGGSYRSPVVSFQNEDFETRHFIQEWGEEVARKALKSLNNNNIRL